MAKKKTSKPLFFDELVNNAFDFLEKAIQQFSTDPKYSVINFCAAIELLLKARLMHEHWSLIVSPKGHPDINAFQRGNFKSINFSDLTPRITAVTGEKIPEDAVKCFNELANHRNKMIHFFHEAHSATAQKKLKEEVAIEQCSGWFFLRRLLERWDPIFSDYNEKITAINYSMKEHEIYLDTVFKRIAPEINKAKKQGIKFVDCKRCKKESSEETQETDNVFEYKCRVCLFEDGAIKIDCPTEDCAQKITLESGDLDQKIICTNCESELSCKEVSEILDTEYADHGDFIQKNCAACGGHGSVVEHNEFYICTECFYYTKSIGYCGWCSEGQIAGGDMEHSYHAGCEFCDGHAAWIKDD